jgi:hypothetical protein
MGKDKDERKPRRQRRIGGALFAGIDDPKRYDLSEFRALHRPLTQRHEEFEALSWLYAVADTLLGFYLECLRLADHRPEEEIQPGTFLNAFIGLSSKVISHAESIRTLTNIGRYGDAAALTRALISDVTMVTYLSIYPEDCADWIELSMVREPTPTSRGRYGQLLAKFRESELRRKIDETGVDPVSDKGYGAFSEAVHASPWGLQFYAYVEPQPRADHTHTIYYAPIYDPWVSIRAITVMTSLLIESIANFLSWCEKTGVTWHKEHLVRWDAIGNMAIRICDAGMAAAQAAFEEFYQPREDSGSG